MNSQRLTRLSSVAVLSLFGACLMRLSSLGTAFRIPECSYATSCAAGFTCANGYCVSTDASNALVVDVQLTPPAASGYVRPVQLMSQYLSSLSSAVLPDYVLSRPIQVSGSIAVPADAPATLTAIEIAAERKGAIAGTTLRFSTFAQRAQSGVWTYSLALLPGTYSFSIIAKEPTIPPVTVQDASIETTVTHNFAFAETASLIEVKGRVVQVGSEVATVSGVSVQLVDDAARIRSTTATTASDGTFMVRIAPGAKAATLQVRSTESGEPYPAVDVDAGIVETGFAALEVSLGDLSGGLVATTFRVVASDGGAVPSARIRSTGVVGAGAVSVTGTTGDGGEWVTGLFAGGYVAEVAPPAGSSCASAKTSFVVGDAGATVSISLPDKTPVLLSVVSAEGAPVASASVSMRRLGELDASTAPWVIDEVLATTDLNGQAAALVDPGRFDVVASPVKSARLPALTTQSVALGSGAVLAIVLPRGLTLTGRVVGSDGTPLADLLVEFFSSNPLATTTPPVIASTVSASDGTFVVTLPNP